jgi:O-antigen/teichoic acid export membrane protein
MIINFFKKKYSKHKIICFSFLWRALQIFGKQGITFLIFIFCAKLLTPYDFGIYNYILAVVFFLIIFGDFGISTATSKYVAEFNATDKSKLKLVLFNSLIIILALGSIVTILTLVFGERFLGDKFYYIVYALPLLFLAPITSLYDGIFRGLRRFKELAIISLSVGGFSLVFVYLLIVNYGLIGALFAQVLFYLLLTLVLSLRYGNLCLKIDKVLIKKIFSYSLVVGLTSVGYYLYSRFDVLVLGHFNYIAEINYFEFFAKISILVTTSFSILGTVIAPNITFLSANNNKREILVKFKKYFLFSFVLGVLISVAIYILLPIIMKYYFKELFNQELLKIFDILVWTLPFSALSGLVSQGFMISTGNAKIGLLTIPFGVLNVFLAIAMIKLFGFIGVAYSSILVSITNKIVSWALLYKVLNNNTNLNNRI